MALVTFKHPASYPSLSDSLFPFVFDKASVPTKGPATNIFELQNEYLLEMKVPGYSKEDIKISVEKDLLTIALDSKESKDENRKLIRREFNLNSFKRVFSLDESVDSEKVSAKYENGILYLSLPKKEELKPTVKEITIS